MPRSTGILGIPDKMRVVAITPIGVPDETAAQKQRKSLEEIVSWGLLLKEEITIFQALYCVQISAEGYEIQISEAFALILKIGFPE